MFQFLMIYWICLHIFTYTVLCLVAQSCLTFCHLMDCSPPGSSVHGDSPGKNTGVGCHVLLQGTFPTQGLNPGFLHCRQILYHLGNEGSPENCIMSWFNWGRIISEYSTAGFPGGSDSQESTCNVGDLGSTPGLRRFPGGGHGNPLQYSCLENAHGQRSLAGCSPRGCKELDTTEWLSTHIIEIILVAEFPKQRF